MLNVAKVSPFRREHGAVVKGRKHREGLLL